MKEKILEKLVLLSLFLLPFGELSRISIQGGISVSLIDIPIGIIFFIWFTTTGKKMFLVTNPVHRAIYIFAFIALFSLVLNSFRLLPSELLISSLYLLRWVAFACLCFIASTVTSKSTKHILFGMIFAGFLLVSLGFVQYFLYPDLRNLYYAGWDEHLYRMFSTFLDPNFFGAFLVLFLLFLIGMGLYFNAEKKSSTHLNIPIPILIGLQIVTLVAIFLTYSRSSYVMLLVSICLLLILTNKKRLIAVVLGVFIVLVLLFSTFLQSEGTNLLRTASGVARIDSMERAKTIIQDNPVVGVGFNAYRYAQYRYGFLTEPKEGFSHSGAGTDNSFLFVFATTGIFGFAAFLYLLFTIMKQSYTNYRSSDAFNKYLGLTLFVSLGGLVVNAFFINSLFYPLILLWVWILVGLMESK